MGVDGGGGGGGGGGGCYCNQKWLKILLITKVKDILFTYMHK